eukprot:12889699-Prorocentrum_lima.AAC.1
MGEKEKTVSGLDVVIVKEDLQILQRDFGLMRDTQTSELSMLEGTIPETDGNRWIFERGSTRAWKVWKGAWSL